MRRRLGKAEALVESDQYLPMFRNRQINYEKEFAFSAKIAKRKKQPQNWFASIWGSGALKRTLQILRSMMAAAKDKLNEAAHRAEELRRDSNINVEGRAKYLEMREQFKQRMKLKLE
jgi:hypothetical protein